MRPKQVYIVPNLLTSVNVLAGMFCIVNASSARSDILMMWYAAAVLFIGMVADILDGIISRLLKASSEFGVQYDSLADVISFGVAPAVLAYNLGLWKLPERMGLGIAFLFTACAALRLARYNTQATTGEKKSFAGMPTPVAAGFIAALTIVLIKYNLVEGCAIPLAVIVVALSYLMISTVKYPSSADMIVIGKKPFVYVTVGTLAIGGAAIRIEESNFIGFAVYVFYGMIRTIYRVFYPALEHGVEMPKGPRRRFFRSRHRGRFLGRFRKNKKE
jgi:CDP-diacylglycerol---serine O-phosphatidyltransferase